MKTKTLFFTVLVLVSATAFAFGSDDPGMTVVSVKGSEVFKVIYKGATTGKIKLNILDAEGRTIHSETLFGLNGFILPVNFKGLQSGNYTIEVVDQAGSYRENVLYLPAYEIKSIHVSKIRNEDGKFLLSIANAQDEPIQVRIFDGQTIVYNESKTIKGDFAQVYKIKDAQVYL